MNKKRLSVVMAGAMLASSVAPVLAATESELDSSKVGTLTETVYKKLISEVFTDKKAGDGSSKLENSSLEGKSVYYVKINGVDAEYNKVAIKNMPVKTDEDKLALRNALQEIFKGLSAGDKVEIFSHGFTKDKAGDVIDCTVTEPVKYKAEDFVETKKENDINKTPQPVNKLALDIQKDLRAGVEKSTKILVNAGNCVRLNGEAIDIYLASTANVGENKTSYKLVTIKKDDEVLDFTKYYVDSNRKTVATIDENTTAAQIHGFPVKYPSGKTSIADELIETIKITGETHNYKTEELYDGLMLTPEGHDLLSIIKEADAQKAHGTSVKFETLNGAPLNTKGNGAYNTTVDLSAVNSEYGFVVKVKDAFGKETVYTVKGAEKNTEILASWLYRRLARVDVLAGDNRYETAVQIAKEQALMAGIPAYENVTNVENTKKIENIVLVNGRSLVDGLAAAPLAAKLTAGTKLGDMAAPMLLTEADELPKATKAYLLELMNNHVIGSTKKAKIHLVGGTTVLTLGLEKELKAMGFDIVRYNGDNREETSLKVAEAVLKDSDNGKRFVVGAEGEADAMSIAAVAARSKTPIIVSRYGGLSYDALEKVKDKKVTVLGGEKSISAEDYLEIKEEAGAVRRIAGANRQATNAAIINEYYGGPKGMDVKSVMVTKDGKGNNDQLVDALTAANLAVQFKAPVVLATKSLSEEQLEVIKSRAKSSKSLYQIGLGVEPSVVETIAARLGLLNR